MNEKSKDLEGETNSSNCKTKGAQWNIKSTNLLINSRLSKDEMFAAKTLSNKGWQAVLSDMRNAGFEKLTLVQIKKKWFNMYAKYKTIKENKNIDDTCEKDWPYFKIIDKFLSSKEAITEVNLNKMTEKQHSSCRLCQEVKGTHSLKKDSILCKQIQDCTSLNILEDTTNLPDSICNECKTVINTFHKFLTRCRKIDKKLKETLKTVEKSSSSIFNCSECPMILISEESLKEHLNSHKKNKRFYCEICHKSFSRIATLNTHQKTHDKDESKEIKNDKIELEDIISENSNDCHDEDFNIHDDENDDSENDEKYVNNDTVKEDNEKNDYTESNSKVKENFNCDLCAKSFERRYDLKVHLESHNNIKYMCPRQECNKSYTTIKALRNHEKKHLGLNRFLCVSCGKGFVGKSALVSHEKIHQDVKEYVCNVCSRGFSTMGNLSTHRKKHHQGHRFYCSQCPKAFLAKCSLQRHELVHTGIKEFPCDLCTGAFYTNKELLKHKRYHQGVRPYHCNQCFKTFYEKHHLTIHMRSHTGERPYPCKIPGCGKSFIDSNKVSRHMKRSH